MITTLTYRQRDNSASVDQVAFVKLCKLRMMQRGFAQNCVATFNKGYECRKTISEFVFRIPVHYHHGLKQRVYLVFNAQFLSSHSCSRYLFFIALVSCGNVADVEGDEGISLLQVMQCWLQNSLHPLIYLIAYTLGNSRNDNGSMRHQASLYGS